MLKRFGLFCLFVFLVVVALIAKGMWIEFHSQWEECLSTLTSGFLGFKRIFLSLKLASLCVA